MKTLGELLTNARQQKKLTPQYIAQVTKIELKYIKALENNHFHKLPPSAFTKGFIRNYAQQVDVSPQEMIAVYRRDNQDPVKTGLSNHNLKHSKQKLNPFLHNNLRLLIIGAITFFAFLAYQYRALVLPPPLEVIQPKKNDVLTSPVTIEGKTSPDSLITINQDISLNPDASGIFFAQINFSPGEYKLTIQSTNRFSRSHNQTIPITVISSL